MKISDFANSINCSLVTKEDKEIQLEGVYIGDLLSVVMAKAKENYAWITIQTHLNVMAVAELLDLSCVIIVENMEIEEDTLVKANELNIPILKTEESAYQVACRLNKLGLK